MHIKAQAQADILPIAVAISVYLQIPNSASVFFFSLFTLAQGMIDEVGAKSIVVGGKVDENEKYVEPTVLKGEYTV